MKIICIDSDCSQVSAQIGDVGVSKVDVFFVKPDTALSRENASFYVPDFSNRVQCRYNVVVRISRICKSIDERFAHRAWNGVTLGVDFTAQNVLQQCVDQHLPWDIAKSFDNSAIVSDRFFMPEELIEIVDGGSDLDIRVNDQLLMSVNANELISMINRRISNVSRYITLKVGDLIFIDLGYSAVDVTVGDRIRCELSDHAMFDFEVK